MMRIVYSDEFERALRKWKKKDHYVFEQTVNKIERIINEPTIGKPLRHTLKNRRRIHIDSFVLIYEFHNNELRFIDLDHHNKVYKK